MKKIIIALLISLFSISLTAQTTRDTTFSSGNYNYYYQQHLQAQKRKGTGMVLVISGVGFSVVGSVVMGINSDENGEIDGSRAQARSGAIMYIGGIIMTNIGIPLWISGGIKSGNNKRAMEKCKKPKLSLNFGLTNNGLGLVYRF
ncbi:MAG: hypothetical protein GQ527_03610 [Bacteroidales bacterium]|nr:hypothetical protein [Bacteroidales bacterium]